MVSVEEIQTVGGGEGEERKIGKRRKTKKRKKSVGRKKMEAVRAKQIKISTE
jgi:hypothetical protein